MADDGINDLLGLPKREDLGGAEAVRIPFPTSAADYPTVYADGCVFATRLGSTVRIAFFETIVEAADAANPGPKNRHVGTLVMPVEGYDAMLRYLNEITPKFIFPTEAQDGE